MFFHVADSKNLAAMSAFHHPTCIEICISPFLPRYDYFISKIKKSLDVSRISSVGLDYRCDDCYGMIF